MAEGLETTHSESTILDDNSNGIALKTEIDETNEEGNNIVAAAMMKLPADQLAMLREDFKKVPFGLSLYQFVSVMLKYAEQQKQNSLAASQRMGGASPRRIKREEAEKKATPFLVTKAKQDRCVWGGVVACKGIEDKEAI